MPAKRIHFNWDLECPRCKNIRHFKSSRGFFIAKKTGNNCKSCDIELRKINNKMSLQTKQKKCPSCNKIKSLSEFAISNVSKDGHQGHCKICRAEYTKEHRVNNKETHKKYRTKYYIDNKDHLLSKKRKWEKDNTDRVAEYAKKNRYKHRERINKNKREYNNKRRATDTEFKILTNLRNRLVKLVKGINKSASTKELLGCSVEFLMFYFKEKYDIELTSDMIGRGRGKWSIDHIRPCASFDLTDPEQQKICFHYTNLQPLLYEENARKKDKYE